MIKGKYTKHANAAKELQGKPIVNVSGYIRERFSGLLPKTLIGILNSYSEKRENSARIILESIDGTLFLDTYSAVNVNIKTKKPNFRINEPINFI